MPPVDVLSFPGDFPQDWPPGPIILPSEDFYFLAPPNGAGLSVGPTPIGNQIKSSPAAASMPPVTPSGTLSGTPQNLGPGPTLVPPTWFAPF
jgi:hypothetical protein